MSARECQLDALIMGAPKAGTSALHAALTQHPQIYASPVKGPSTTCAGTLPHRPTAVRATHTATRSGSGGVRIIKRSFTSSRAVHTTGEHAVLSLFTWGSAQDRRGASGGEVDHDRPGSDRPGVLQLDASVGGRAGADLGFRRRMARRRQPGRGWMGTWHYRRLGRYGEQLADLLSRVERERVFVLRWQRRWCPIRRRR